MKLTNNEKGSTLVIVLLIVAFITILGASLFTMNMSASKQFTNKEHQVQARHLAEMGVMHYQAAVEEVVHTHNQKEPVKYYIGSGENRRLDEKKTREEHTKKICNAITEIAPPIYENSPTYKYIVEIKEKTPLQCKASTPEIAIEINSEGTSNETTRLIAAKINVMSLDFETDPGGDNNDGNNGNDGENGEDIEKPTDEEDEEYEFISSFPNGSFTKEKNVKFTGAGQIEGGTIEAKFKKNFEINASLTIGRLNNDHIKIFVGRDFKGFDSLNIGGGWDSLYEFIVARDFYQQGSFTLNRQKNFDSRVDENKLIVCGNAYLSQEPNLAHHEDLFLVQGTVYNYDGTQKRSNQYKPKNTAFDFGKYCSNTQPNPDPVPNPDPSLPTSDSYNWEVQPDVNADYFPGKNND